MFKKVLKSSLLTVIEAGCLVLDVIIWVVEFYVSYCDLALGMIAEGDDDYTLYERFCIKVTGFLRNKYNHIGRWLNMLRSPLDEILEKNGR